jgi:hypothetical protein
VADREQPPLGNLAKRCSRQEAALRELGAPFRTPSTTRRFSRLKVRHAAEV